MEVLELFSIVVKLILVLLVILFSLIYLYLRKDYGYWEKRGVRHAKPVFVFGNLEFVMRTSFWDFFYNLGKRFPDPYVGVFLGHKPALVIQNADLARKILVKDSDHFEDRFIYADKDDRMGTLNLFTLKNPAWTEMRKQLSPMFTSSRLRTLSELMNFNSQELVKRIDREHVARRSNPVHLKDLFSRYTSDTVGYSVFGLRTSALNEDKNPLWGISSLMVQWTFWRGFEFSIMFFVPAIARILRLQFFSAAATEYIKKLFHKVVEEREKTGKKTDLDLVNQLLKIQENIKIPNNENSGYPEDLMLGQVAVFILGAIETSSSTLTYCLHELSHHPNIQDKLYTEIDEAVQTAGGRVLTFDELINLRFLNSCIQETLRKHTAVPHIDRICAADYKIDDNLTIEKGTPVLINLEAIHHDERNYPEPSKWLPERFTGIAADSDNRNFTFLPFGEGPRFCIGKRYGMCQIRAALAQVLHRYRLEPAGPYEIPSDPYSLILSPRGGGVVKFVPRESSVYFWESTVCYEKKFLGFLLRAGKKYKEPYIGVFLGHKPALLVQSADIARNILVRDSAFFEDRFLYADKSDPIGNVNLFNVKNPTWSAIRKELNPMFTPSQLKTLIELMNLNAVELVKRIQREYVEKKNPVCLKDLFSRYTSDTVGYTVFGLRTSALNEDDNPLWYISSNIVKWTFRRGFEFSIMFYVPAVAGLLKLKFFSEAATEYLKKVFKTVVENRVKSGKTNDRDLVSQLLKVKDDIKIPEDEGPEYPENLMIAQAAGFIFGAIGTSTATLTFCLHELSHHPKQQEKLYTEIETEIKRSGKDVLGFDELLEMRYLNSCIQETLRKYTPIPHLDRLCGADYKIDDNLTIEKGTPVLINLEAIHHDERNYPEPSKWLPERFTGIAADSDNRNFTFLPFGEGPRFCIGKRYGMNQIRAALAQVVHKYRLEPAGPYEIPSDPYSLVLSPKGGGVVKFVPRGDCL